MCLGRRVGWECRILSKLNWEPWQIEHAGHGKEQVFGLTRSKGVILIILFSNLCKRGRATLLVGVRFSNIRRRSSAAQTFEKMAKSIGKDEE